MESPPDFTRMQIEELQKRVSALEAELAQWVRRAEDNHGRAQRLSLQLESATKTLDWIVTNPNAHPGNMALAARQAIREILSREDLDYFAANMGGQ